MQFDGLRTTVILGLLAGIALSPKLWLSTRYYPLTPVWGWIGPFASPLDAVVLLVCVGLLLLLCVVPRRELFVAAFALLFLLALQDQSRWQPWFYQYVLMLLAVALAGLERRKSAWNVCSLIIAATYIWSGLAKLNPNFATDVFPSLLQPFLGARAEHLQRFAIAAPILEFALGAGLFTRRFRRMAAIGAIAMHVLILVSIGPFGSRFNTVVWPWNAAMIVFVAMLFLRREEQPAWRELVWARQFAFHRLVFVLFGVLPAFTWFGLWDQYLSAALYSGNRNSGEIYMNDAVFDRLPDAISDYVTDDGPNRGGLDINEWSLGEMNVPAYPEIRILRNVARRVAAYGPGVTLEIQRKYSFVHSNEKEVLRP